MRRRGQVAALAVALALPIGFAALVALAVLGHGARQLEARRIAEERALRAVAAGAERATATAVLAPVRLRIGRHRLALAPTATATAHAERDPDGRRVPLVVP